MLKVGDEAPDFDLSSTEEALLMLRDEVFRRPALVYFFSDPAAERTAADLDALNRGRESVAKAGGRILAVSPARMAELRKLQGDRKLLFPLCQDDRDFTARYGATEGPALFLVDRRRRIAWMANPLASAEVALPQAIAALKAQGRSTETYPKSVLNRFVNWLVG